MLLPHIINDAQSYVTKGQCHCWELFWLAWKSRTREHGMRMALLSDLGFDEYGFHSCLAIMNYKAERIVVYVDSQEID